MTPMVAVRVLGEGVKSDHTLNSAKIKIAGCVWSGQHEAAVEDVERLVFHCAHVEIIDSDDIEEVKVVLKTKRVLVPLHGFLQTK